MARRLSPLLATLALLGVVIQPVAATSLGAVVNVTGDLYTNDEITIALNPANPLNLISGYNDYNRNEGCGTNRSPDGGQTWSAHSFIPGITPWDNAGNTYPGNGTYDFGGDPSVTFTADGTAYFACYGYKFGSGNGAHAVALFVSKSTDGGLTWGAPNQLTTFTGPGLGNGVNKGSNGQFPDHGQITADTWAGSPYEGSLYVAQAQYHGDYKAPIMLWYSRDGATWHGPVRVSSGSQDTNQNAVPFVGPDGSVYVTFNSLQGTNGATQIRIAKSSDGGATFGPSYTITDVAGTSVEAQGVLGNVPNSDYRTSLQPAPAIDAAGRITVAWNDDRSGHQNVWYRRAWASDLTTWTAATQLKPSTGEQFFPWAHAAPNGRVDLVYYDRTRDPNDTLNFVTYSHLDPTSGLGVTATSLGAWSPAFNGNVAGGQLTTGCVPFIGDYIGLASDDSHVYVSWTGNGPSVFHNEFGNPTSCDVNQDELAVAITP
jgi:hypothetical protein